MGFRVCCWGWRPSWRRWDCAGLLVARVARDAITGFSIGLLVMAVFLALLAQIATVAYVPAAVLAVTGLVGLGAAGLGRVRGQSK